MHRITERAHQARCPRCGYDQQGAIDAWTDMCPLHMNCSECGLEFRTAELLRPELGIVPWLVECSTRWPQFLKAWIQTSARIIDPRSFWARVSMPLPSRPFMIVSSIALMLLLSVIVLWLTYGIVVLRHGLDYDRGVEENIRNRIAALNWEEQRNGETAATFQMKLKLEEDLQEPTVAWRGTLKAMLNPMSNARVFRRSGYRSQRTPYKIWSRFIDRAAESWNPTNPEIIYPAVASLAMPLLILGLPITRRRAKVQARHVIRAGLYGILMLSIAAPAASGAIAIPSFWSSSPIRGGDFRPLITFLACAWLLWWILWWYAALRTYMKLPHAAGIVAIGLLWCYVITLIPLAFVL